MSGSTRPPVWWGWGEAERHAPLDAETAGLLAALLGDGLRTATRVGLDQVVLPGSRLAARGRRALVAAVGDAAVADDHATRVRHAAGRSTTDLLALRTGRPAAAPDAVVAPRDHDQVVAVLGVCAEHDLAVVPLGGGTSVVGGVAPLRGSHAAVVALDLVRLDRLQEVDEVSQTARFEAGVRAPRAEALLAEHGLTLGHFPQSFELASLGGFAATRSAGQASAGYGRFDELVEGLRVATPVGELRLGRAPASAAGPDLRQLFLGSEGVLGVMTELTLRVRHAPALVVDEAWRFADLEAGIGVLRQLAQADGLRPTVLRLSDETESAVLGGGNATGCTAVVCYEGDAEAIERRRPDATAMLRGAGGDRLDAEAAAGWRRGRFEAPYLRDALLDAGALIETLETATSWSRLSALHRALRDALEAALRAEGAAGVVLAHVSHVYASGASLYLTVVTAAGDDPVARWGRLKAAASAAIVDAGATITHHHAVGLVHRAWLEAEIGALGVEVLRAVKARLDPAGILNPGKLISVTGGVPDGGFARW